MKFKKIICSSKFRSLQALICELWELDKLLYFCLGINMTKAMFFRLKSKNKENAFILH